MGEKMKNADSSIKKMEVDMLSKQEIEMEIEDIVSLAIQKRIIQKDQNILQRLKQIYWGPGLRVIFYNSEVIWLSIMLIYILFCFCGYRTPLVSEARRFSLMFLGTPLVLLLYGFLNFYFNDSENVIELKSSLHYSLNYIVGLQMFYISIVMILINVCMTVIIYPIAGRNILTIASFGTSSALIFAIIFIHLYRGFGPVRCFWFLGGMWCVMTVVIVRIPLKYYHFIFIDIPLYMHVIVLFGCFVCFVLLIKRLEEKDAYSFAY